MTEDTSDKKIETKVSELEKPSEGVQKTNLDTAYFRSFSDIPNSKALSELIGAEKATEAERLEDGFENQKSIIPFFEARYKAIDALIRRSGITQVIEFAAGRTTRGINNPDWSYLHTDQDEGALSQMEEVSKALSKEPRSKPQQFLKFDAISSEGMDALIGGLKDEPVAIVHEGLMTYYPLESKAKIALNAKKLLERFGGVYITPDIHTNEYFQMIQLSPNYKERQRKRSERTGRDLESLRFNSLEQAKAFFGDLGFKEEVYHLGDLVPSLYCIDVLFDDPKRKKLVSDTILKREIWLLTLKIEKRFE